MGQEIPTDSANNRSKLKIGECLHNIFPFFFVRFVCFYFIVWSLTWNLPYIFPTSVILDVSTLKGRRFQTGNHPSFPNQSASLFSPFLPPRRGPRPLSSPLGPVVEDPTLPPHFCSGPTSVSTNKRTLGTCREDSSPKWDNWHTPS